MKRILFLLVLLTFVLLPTRPAHASSGALDGQVVIGHDFILKSSETLDGDLVVIGGEVAIEHGALVKGDVAVIGGGLRLEGQTTGSAVVIGGPVSVGAQASIGGDVVTLGGSLQRAEGAQITGNIVSSLPAPTLVLPRAEMSTRPISPAPALRFDFGSLGAAAALLFQAIGLAAVAMLLAAFLHPQLDRVAQAVIKQPFAAGSIGLLTIFLAPIAVVILAVTLILIPVAVAAVILLALAWLFGVVALGMELGDRLKQALHRTWEPVLVAGIGAFVLAIVVGAVAWLPCIGWLAPVLVGLIGLGAAVITLFGTRPTVGTALVSVPTTVSGGGEATP
jgi:hypothetical protein